ncbi:tRNA pseudouridine synthase 1 [Mactra antiquata]
MLRRFYARVKQFINPYMASLTETSISGKRVGEDVNDGNCKKHKTEGLPDRKRKVALLIAYNGKGYYGLQLNPGLPTIESTVIKALLDVGVIPQDHHDTPQKMSLQRAARTDKNVSAAGNILSLKMLLNVENLVDKINEKLPPQIKVFDYIRTTNGFNCKVHCTGRTYIYILPTYAMAPVEEICTLEYRTNVDILEKMNEVLEKYIGTHNFHNFTSGVKANDPSAKRYMKHFECGLPFVRDGVEFCVISVTGQSFMLHQIRKMIGLAIAIVKGFTQMDSIDTAFEPEKFDVPIAPGLGLVLEKLHYDQYNRKWASDGERPKLEFSYLRDKLEAFKDEYIVSCIVKEEIESQSMMQWLPTLHKHSFEAGSSVQLPSINRKEKPSDNKSSDENQSKLDNQSDSNTCTGTSVPISCELEKDAGTNLSTDSTNQNECSKSLLETDCNTNISTESTSVGESLETQSDIKSKTESLPS